MKRERIEKAGGSVVIQRVYSSLEVSRALGGFDYKDIEGKGPTDLVVSSKLEFFSSILLEQI